MQTLVLLACVVVAATAQTCSYSSVCTDHTMCKYSGYGSSCGTVKYNGVTAAADQQKVVNAHNRVRSVVALGKETRGTNGAEPAASNMNQLVWDNELATIAQRWAEQCSFGHDSCRSVSRYYVGQNVYESSTWGSAETSEQNWDGAVNAWYDEVAKFNKNNISPFQSTSGTGHYTQAVWATTKTVGCGFVAYKGSDGWYNKYYVCNYGPGGNIIGSTIYKAGTACSACTNGCESSTGLCL